MSEVNPDLALRETGSLTSGPHSQKMRKAAEPAETGRQKTALRHWHKTQRYDMVISPDG
jgi:hypothetical protein